MEYYFKALRHYADFSGRASRKEYWMFFLFYVASVFAVALVGVLIGTAIKVYIPQYYARILLMFYMIAVTVPFLALSVRRLHDSGKSGWWMLLGLFQVLNAFVNGLPHDDETSKTIAQILAVAAGICILIFMLLPGREGKNRYGANPDNIIAYGKRVFAKSTGITLIIAMSIFIVNAVIPLIRYYMNMQQEHNFNLYFLIDNLPILLIMAAGILFVFKKDMTKEIGILLSAAATMQIILFVLFYTSLSKIVDEISIEIMLNTVLNILGNAALLIAGTALIQQGIKRQMINISVRVAAICLIIAYSLSIVFMVYNCMTNPELHVISIFYIVSPVAFFVLARYLLLPHDTMLSETSVIDDNGAKFVQRQTVQTPHGIMHFAFAIVNIVVGVIFLFAGIIALVQTGDAVVIVILALGLFLWIEGFVYLVKREYGSQALRILNIIAAVISFILTVFTIITIILIND
ncbi:MAG: DUF805 domain-containing protein [Prevotellaceae bacterium]|jgi:uncharacterized membrane protein YhaH (DUF805 family)|nr:DUF805 domain-containing protein [Prevotellaceae bacterium]